jgi:ubiquinone biosynthesis protein UbiJ
VKESTVALAATDHVADQLAVLPLESVTVPLTVGMSDQAVAVKTDWLAVADCSVHVLPPVAVIVTTPASSCAVADHGALLPCESVTVPATVRVARSASVWFTVKVIVSPTA